MTTYVQCELSVGSVSWGASDGAQWYVAVATGPDGHTHRCVTNSTSCTWDDLHCGGRYSVVVSARDETCASPPSNSTLIHTGTTAQDHRRPTAADGHTQFTTDLTFASFRPVSVPGLGGLRGLQPQGGLSELGRREWDRFLCGVG